MIGKQDWATEALKLAPPATVGGLKFLGLAITDWVGILTAIYLLMLLGERCVRYYLKWKESRYDSKKVEQEFGK